METSKYYKLLDSLLDKKDLLSIIKNEDKIKEIVQELDIYHAELAAQNNELLEKEQKLLDSKKEYELFFYDAPVAYLIINKSFVIERFNKKADEYLGISSNLQKRQLLFSYFEIKYLESFLAWISKEDFKKKALELNIKLNKKISNRFKIYGNKYPLDEDYILLSLIDVNEEYLLKNQLQKQVEIKTKENLEQYHIMQQQSKLAAMGEMIANIAHQWRQPLNILSAYNIDIVLKYKHNKLTNKTIDNFSENSQNLIEKMSSIIESFVNFFKPSKEKMLFNIVEIFNESFELLDNSFSKHDIKIELNCDKEIFYKGYKSEFEQVILIILNNSKDSIILNKEQGEIIINVFLKDDNFIDIEILDNAGGINKDIIDRIFEPYFSTKNKAEGTGIGLYMSKLIIEQSMHGEIKVKNYNDGLKTSIRLPLE